jgi:predicted DNA binding CopG/RHH family protein
MQLVDLYRMYLQIIVLQCIISFMSDKTNITLRLPSELLKQVKHLAKIEDRPISRQFERLLYQSLQALTPTKAKSVGSLSDDQRAPSQ